MRVRLTNRHDANAASDAGFLQMARAAGATCSQQFIFVRFVMSAIGGVQRRNPQNQRADMT